MMNQDELDIMRLDDDGAPSIPSWQDVYDAGPEHERWPALQGLCARISTEVTAMMAKKGTP